MTDEWPAWRLVVEGRSTVAELEALSIDDVLDANDALTVWARVKEAASDDRP